MNSKLILLTGSTGHVGFRVLVLALQAGYQVRAAVRNLPKTEAILAASSIQKINPGSRLTFVEIPDMIREGAFDEALRDVDYIIHVASPLATNASGIPAADIASYFSGPIVQGSINLLDSAKKHRSIKRVVVTSSISALLGPETTNAVITEETRLAEIPSPPYESPLQGYSASKAEALLKSEQWVNENKPAFDVVYILPGYVFGPNELVNDAKEMLKSGTNRIILTPATGGNYKTTLSSTIHLDDVARAHVHGLQSKVPGNQVYILHSGGTNGSRLEESLEITARNFPNEIGNTLLNNGSVSTNSVKIDASKSMALLGFEFLGFERQVTDTVRYYLECLRKQQS